MSTCVFQYHIFINKKINMILQYILFNFILHDRSKYFKKLYILKLMIHACMRDTYINENIYI